MSQFEEIITGESVEFPAKTIVYGVPKIGKTRFASQANDPFFIDVEGGLSYIDKKVRATPKLNSYDEIIGWLKHIHDTDTFKAGTIVLDSLDWCETLAQARLVKLNGASTITDPKCKAFAFFRGVVDAADDTFQILKWLNAIFIKRGIKSIIIAHSQIKEVDVPDKDAYSRYELKLSKQLAAKASEWADLILFADYDFEVTSEGKTSEPKPVIYAGGSASFVGGGRMKLNKKMPLDYKEIEKHITKKESK